MKKNVLVMAFALALALGSPGYAVTVTQIGSGGFSGAASTIGFEGVSGDGSRYTPDVLVIGGTTVWGGTIATDGVQGIPAGVANSGVNSYLDFSNDVVVLFSTPVNRVGAYYIVEYPAGDIKMELYDVNDVLFSTVVGSKPADAGTRLGMRTGFIGAESDLPILGVSFKITGAQSTPDFSIDDVRFEVGLNPLTPPPQGAPVPEPATMLLLGAGLLAAGALRRRK